ncbi:MAG TPA: S49 family peptidase, partial [Gammaproteobacteria bacterium]
YEVFVTKVAANRGLEFAAVDEVARGRVWSGSDALEHRLVDSLGGLHQAIEAAASIAALDEYVVVYPEPELSFFDRFLIDTFQAAAPHVSRYRGIDAEVLRLPVVRQLAVELQRLQQFNDPRGIYALCFCGMP